MGFRSAFRELIGSVNPVQTRIISSVLPTVDARYSDYAYWDRARRGAVTGLETSGLFLKPLGSKVAAWVMVPGPDWKTEKQKTQDALNDWWTTNLPKIIRAYEESLGLGDAYLVINPDLTCTLLPPNVVYPIYDTVEPTAIVGWTVREVYPIYGTFQHVTITDDYTANRRTRTIERQGADPVQQSFPNRIGVIPVIHIGNYLGSDELFGRPEGEGLINALQRYGEIMDAAVKGNVRQGRPTPVIQKMGSNETVNKFWERHGRKEKRTLPDGTSVTIDVIDFDPDQLLTLSGEAEFKYAAPGSFSGDTEILLGLLFYLILQHTEIPEFVWGNAISSSKASAESQLEPFVKWLGKKRAMSAGWMTDISKVVLAYFEVMRPDLPAETQDPVIEWHSITNGDGKNTINAVEFAYKSGWLDDVDGLAQLPLSISDPQEAVKRGQAAMKKRTVSAPPKPVIPNPNDPNNPNSANSQGQSNFGNPNQQDQQNTQNKNG